MNSLSCRRGFSFVERVIVIIIACILVSIVISRFGPNGPAPQVMVTTPSGEEAEVKVGEIIMVTLRRGKGLSYHLEEGTYLISAIEYNGVNWEVGLRKLGKPGFPRLTYFLSDYVFKKETSTYIWVQVIEPTDPQYKDLMVEFAKGGGK